MRCTNLLLLYLLYLRGVCWLRCCQQVEEVLVLQKRITQIQNDKTQAQSQLAEATNKLDTIQKQLSMVN